MGDTDRSSANLPLQRSTSVRRFSLAKGFQAAFATRRNSPFVSQLKRQASIPREVVYLIGFLDGRLRSRALAEVGSLFSGRQTFSVIADPLLLAIALGTGSG